jgi:hypothetical protein
MKCFGWVLAPMALVLALLTPAIALGLPTCAQIGTDPTNGLVGNPQIVAGSVHAAIMPAKAPEFSTTPFHPEKNPPTPSYCQVDFTYSALSGPPDGYDVGQKQMIKIQIWLPLSAADGGSGGVEGNWVGKALTSASPGSSSAVGVMTSHAEARNLDGTYAIRLGYAGSTTDTGQGNPPFGVIQTGTLAHTLALGTIADWAYRGTHYGKQLMLSLCKTYYGLEPTRSYYDGSSGGGNEGMGQLQQYGDEYDGFLIAAPAFSWQQFRLANAWPNLVFKKLVQKGGKLPSGDQIAAVNAAAVAACDVEGDDSVKDGLIADPRACTFSATANICGKPGAPADQKCVTTEQAAAIDKIWDGPRNHSGSRIWYPVERGSGIAPDMKVGPDATQVMQWNHKDTDFDANNLYLDAESLTLAGNPPNGITYEDEAALGANTNEDYTENQSAALDLARECGTKVILLYGMQDGQIYWRRSVDYYRRVATYYYGGGKADFAELQKWFRLFPMPGVGHVADASGPTPYDPFLALVNWVEKGIAPDKILAGQGGGDGAPATRTRPLCPYPQTAVYNGKGSTDDAANFHCGGNLETQQVLCNDARTFYKRENRAEVDYRGIGAEACRTQQKSAH